MEYSYGIPGKFIWSMHIVIGLLLFYVGYRALNGWPVSQILALLLVVLGSLAILYHGHLFYVKNK